MKLSLVLFPERRSVDQTHADELQCRKKITIRALSGSAVFWKLKIVYPGVKSRKSEGAGLVACDNFRLFCAPSLSRMSIKKEAMLGVVLFISISTSQHLRNNNRCAHDAPFYRKYCCTAKKRVHP